MNKQTTNLMLSLFAGLTMMSCNAYVAVSDPKLTNSVDKLEEEEDREEIGSKPIQWLEFSRTSGFMPQDAALRYNARLRIDLRGTKVIATLESQLCSGTFSVNPKIAAEIAKELAAARITKSQIQALDAGTRRITFQRDTGEVVNASLGASDGSYGDDMIVEDGRIRGPLEALIAERQAACEVPEQSLKVVRLQRTSSYRSDAQVYPVNRKYEQLSAEIFLEGESLMVSARMESKNPLSGEKCGENVQHSITDADLVKRARAITVTQNNIVCLMMMPYPDSLVINHPLQVSLKDVKGTVTEWAGFGCHHNFQVTDPLGFLPRVNKLLAEKQKCLANPLQIENL